MKKSIIEQEPVRGCFVCGRSGYLERHHIFGGANRRWSEKYGLTVHLCYQHHRDSKEGVHSNAQLMEELHQLGQQVFEQTYPEMRFKDIFKINYLDENNIKIVEDDNKSDNGFYWIVDMNV